jgi:hypothetical protein
MSSLYTATPRHGLLRATALVFASLLACQAIWILVAEYYRPGLTAFPVSAQAAATAATNRDAATLAASVGVIRGDLWAESALTYLDLYWSGDRSITGPQISEIRARASEVAERALAFAPHDARIWVALASFDSAFNTRNRETAAALRMSYYTGANEADLIALRLPLAVRSDALDDSDFQRLVSHDIRIIVTHKPELKPVIATAYREASPIGQKLLEETLQEIDPALLAMLRSKG